MLSRVISDEEGFYAYLGKKHSLEKYDYLVSR